MLALDRLRTHVEMIYAAQYAWTLRRWHGDSKTAAFTTATSFAAALMANLLFVYAIMIVGFDLAPFSLPRWAYLIPPMMLLIAAQLWLGRVKRASEWADALQRLPTADQKRLERIGWAYLGVSFAAPIALGFLADALID